MVGFWDLDQKEAAEFATRRFFFFLDCGFGFDTLAECDGFAGTF